jgi:hypothetical protein
VLQKLQTPHNDLLLQFQNNGSSSCFTPDGVRCRSVLTLLVRFLAGYPDISDNVYCNYQTPGAQGKFEIILYLLIFIYLLFILLLFTYLFIIHSLFIYDLFTYYLLFTFLLFACLIIIYLFIIFLFITYLLFVYFLLI